MRLATQLQRFFEGVVGIEEAPGLAVYRELYRVRLAEALRLDYPSVLQIVGDERFAELAEQYRRAYPSKHPSLRHYPRHFAALLERCEPARPELAELAALEWARVDVFDDPDETPLSLRELARVPPEELVAVPLQRIRALRVVPARFCVETQWRDPAAAAQRSSGATSALLVWRVLPNQVFHRRATAGELDWLHQLRAPTTLAALCARERSEPEPLVRRLQQFVHEGIVTKGGIG